MVRVQASREMGTNAPKKEYTLMPICEKLVGKRAQVFKAKVHGHFIPVSIAKKTQPVTMQQTATTRSVELFAVMSPYPMVLIVVIAK